jgi:hypothetical protein
MSTPFAVQSRTGACLFEIVVHTPLVAPALDFMKTAIP